MANLIPTKFLDFKGLERNSNQPDRQSNLLRIKNMDTHHKPGTLTLREGYELRYPKPVDDDYSRLENTEYVSFDNFFERTAGQGTEITVLVEKSEVVAPTVSGSKLNSYKYRSANVWIRPYWNGTYWLDAWQWLNESFITNITVAPDATYKNKIQFEGYFGNLTQWTILNVTKDTRVPAAVIRTEENGTNTDCWLSDWDPQWDVDDIVVLMRNYIPLSYQIQNYDVLRKEISFHRILSKMRIGFGGKEGRLGYGIQFVKQTLQLADYSFTAVDPTIVGDEFIYAVTNKVVLQPYTAFNDNEDNYRIIVDHDTGNFIAGTYGFRMTVVLDGTDEIMVVDHEEVTQDPYKFIVKGQIRLGSFNRRITAVKFYFSVSLDDYYLIEEKAVSLPNEVDGGAFINSPDWTLLENGWIQTESVAAAADQHVESNAASSADTNAVGSWGAFGGHFPPPTVAVVAASNFAIRTTANGNDWLNLNYDMLQFSPLIKAGGKYTLTINAKASVAMKAQLALRYFDINDVGQIQYLPSISIGTSYASQDVNITVRDDFTNRASSATFFYFDLTRENGTIATGDYFELEELNWKETDTPYVDADTELGSSMLTELGYQPTFNIVRDWIQGVILNGITWLAGSYIKDDGRYDNKLFGSQISGLGANMHDVVPAQTVLDVDRYKGEVIVGIAVLSNNSIVALKDGAIIILDPDTGQKYETAIGDGCVIKNTILVIRNTLYWQSNEDVLKMAASTGYIAEPISDRYVRDILNQITDKTTAHAVLDKYGAYRIALVDDKEGVEFPELLLHSRGWENQERYHHPEVYRNGLGGRVWFMNEGDIYAFPFDEDAFIGYADVYGNYDSGW